MTDKKILDMTCGSRTIWFNKDHPAAVYCDKRRESRCLRGPARPVLGGERAGPYPAGRGSLEQAG